MMYLHLLSILIQLICLVSSSPFPDQMLHSDEETTVLRNLHHLGYQTTRIPPQIQASKQIPLHSLMPYACNYSNIDSFTLSEHYGLIGFQSKTYTRQYFPQGRYYNSISEYDLHCTCPFTRTLTWNPEANWTTLESGEFLQKTNRIEVIRFATFQKQRYNIKNDYRKNLQGGIKIDAIQSIYLSEISTLLPYIIVGFYETFLWVKWKMDVIHAEDTKPITSAQNEIADTAETEPCRINIEKLLISFNHKKRPQIHSDNRINAIPFCNKNDFIKIEVVNSRTTKITIPGGRFRTIPRRKQRSLIHLGIGQTNIFQWENWQLYESIKIPTWYIITIINGPIRTRKTAIHFALEHQLSYLTAIPDVMLSNTLLPSQTMMAYHKGGKYCERISSATTDMHNAQYVQQRQYNNCHNYHNNTNICAKTQEPQCRFAVGCLKTAMEKSGILPDIEENKPSIAYSNACFLPKNYTIYGNVTRIHDSPRTRREVTLAAVISISVLMGALIASIIEVQMKTYNDMVNTKLEDLENTFTLQLNQVEDQVTDLQIQQLELADAIATLSRITANLANRQQRFENFVLAFNRQLLEQQIITTRRSIENRKLILSLINTKKAFKKLYIFILRRFGLILINIQSKK